VQMCGLLKPAEIGRHCRSLYEGNARCL
jgi:hypothetical protein